MRIIYSKAELAGVPDEIIQAKDRLSRSKKVEESVPIFQASDFSCLKPLPESLLKIEPFAGILRKLQSIFGENSFEDEWRERLYKQFVVDGNIFYCWEKKLLCDSKVSLIVSVQYNRDTNTMRTAIILFEIHR